LGIGPNPQSPIPIPKINSALKSYNSNLINNLALQSDFQNNPNYTVKSKLTLNLKILNNYIYNFNIINKFNSNTAKLSNTFRCNFTKENYLEISNDKNLITLNSLFKTNTLSKGSIFNHNITFDKLAGEFNNYFMIFQTKDYGDISFK
jgi:hypothetical protein